MPKNAHSPAHRGAPRPLRAPSTSLVKAHVPHLLRGHGKLAGRALLSTGLAAGVLITAPAANAATAPAESAPQTVAAAVSAYHVVKAPTIKMSPLGEVQHATQVAYDYKAVQRAAAAKRKAELAARAAAEAKRKAAERARAIAASASGKIGKAVDTAIAHTGAPYVWGATGPSSFDCSGLVLYSYGGAGFSLPRTADAQSHAVRHIPSSQLQRGDLIFFSSGSHVYHVGIFLRWESGQAIMLHAPHPGASVREEAAWGSSWFAGTLR